MWGLVFKVAVDFHRRQLYRRLAALSIFAAKSRSSYLNLNKFPNEDAFSLALYTRPKPPALSLSRAHSNLFLTPLLSPRDGVVNREFTFRTFHLVGAPPGRWSKGVRCWKKLRGEAGGWENAKPRNFTFRGVRNFPFKTQPRYTRATAATFYHVTTRLSPRITSLVSTDPVFE